MKEESGYRMSVFLSGCLPVLALIFGVYIFIGRFVAGIVVDFTQNILMGTWYYNLIMCYFSAFMDRDSFVPSLLIGEYGLLTMVPVYLLGLLLPLVFSFYFVLYLLKDSGLLHRSPLGYTTFDIWDCR